MSFEVSLVGFELDPELCSVLRRLVRRALPIWNRAITSYTPSRERATRLVEAVLLTTSPAEIERRASYELRVMLRSWPLDEYAVLPPLTPKRRIGDRQDGFRGKFRRSGLYGRESSVPPLTRSELKMCPWAWPKAPGGA